eukprot:7849589-Lingulodinium_polyedra.AAC.1
MVRMTYVSNFKIAPFQMPAIVLDDRRPPSLLMNGEGTITHLARCVLGLLYPSDGRQAILLAHQGRPRAPLACPP